MGGWPTAPLLVLAATACLNGPRSEGWAPAENTGGPVVVYDIDARPLPEVPLPNDAATRLDPTSPTGRRLNVSPDASTEHEREVRANFNRLDGFGTYAPIAVSFTEPLDLVDLVARHATDDFRDDPVLLLNIDRDCARYGEEVAFDIGRHRFPVTLYGHADSEADALAPEGRRIDTFGNTLFPFDVHATDNNYLFQETNEDRDGDGDLDPGEDVDDDGVLDVANFLDPAACDGVEPYSLAYDRCVADNLLTWYERETNTLILKPLWPLEEQCQYAVVLSKRLQGEDGRAVMSPFPGVNVRDQTEALRPAEALLGRYDLTLDDVAFAWTFTTGTQTRDLLALREGLYGSGPWKRLADEFPVQAVDLWTRGELAARFEAPIDPSVAGDVVVPGACAGAGLTKMIREVYGEGSAQICAVEADHSAVVAWFGGTYAAPNFLVDKDGHASAAYAADNDEYFAFDWQAGTGEYGSTDVTFFCSLPYEQDDVSCLPGNPDGRPFCKPFPVILYAHGYGGSRAELVFHMGRHAAMGVAACGIDSYGHGLNRWTQDPIGSVALRAAIPQFTQLGVPDLPAFATIGRDRDLTNDGLADPGMDMWTADIFHTRDLLRQSALEVSQFVRILRHMDGTTEDGSGGLLGDVDGDGVVDLGGPTNTISHWGISLGGILSGVLTGSEPGFAATSPNAAAAGLTDVSKRSTQDGVPEAVVMPMLGQLVAGCLPTDGHDNPVPVGEPTGDDCWRGEGNPAATWSGGTLRLAMIVQNELRDQALEFGSVEGVQVGDRLTLTNLRSGESATATVGPRGFVRAGVAADAMDPIERRAELGWGDAPGTFEVADPTLVADPLEVVVTRDGKGIGKVDSFTYATSFQGTSYPSGAALVAIQRGFGYHRNGPELRRLKDFAQHAISAADPGTWSARAFMDPPDVSAYDPFDDGEPVRTMVMTTAGDQTVPASTGVALGRASGTLGSWLRDPDQFGPEVGWRAFFAVDPRYGTSPERWLVEQWVVEADKRLQRFADNPVNPNVVFDADDVSDGTARWSCGPSDWSAAIGENYCPDEVDGLEVFYGVPHPAPGDALRATRDRGDGFFDGFRIPVVRSGGQHGIYNAQPFRVFDADAYLVNLTSRYLATGGRRLDHVVGCDCSGSGLPNVTLDGEPTYPGLGEACVDGSMKVCDPVCSGAWGLRTPEEAICTTP